MHCQQNVHGPTPQGGVPALACLWQRVPKPKPLERVLFRRSPQFRSIRHKLGALVRRLRCIRLVKWSHFFLASTILRHLRNCLSTDFMRLKQQRIKLSKLKLCDANARFLRTHGNCADKRPDRPLSAPSHNGLTSHLLVYQTEKAVIAPQCHWDIN